MKKMGKMFATISIALVLLVGGFVGGAYANSAWVKFTGEQKAEDTEDNIDELLDIIEMVNDGKLSAKDGIKKLEEEVRDKQKEIGKLTKEVIDEKDKANKLDKEISDLRKEQGKDSNYIDHLEDELEDANEAVDDVYDTSVDAVEEAREYVEEND